MGCLYLGGGVGSSMIDVDKGDVELDKESRSRVEE